MLSPAEIERAFDLDEQLKHVDHDFRPGLSTGRSPSCEGCNRMRARVFVTLKPSVFDPQGQTIADALHSLGYGGVRDVRQGKYFELDLSTSEAVTGEGAGGEVADKLLANPVIESYRIEWSDGDARCLRSRDNMKFAVIVFPGSNCDEDAYHAAMTCSGRPPSTSGTRTPI